MKAFVADAVDQKLAGSTISKHRLLFKHLGNFAQNRGLRYLTELSLERLGEFRSSWKDGPRSSAKKLERLRAFFRFAQDRELGHKESSKQAKGSESDSLSDLAVYARRNDASSSGLGEISR
jgi:site-specific recombinase XerD